MKTIEQLQTIAEKVFFDKNKKIKKMYATPDGNFFYEDDFNAAIAHANGGDLFQLTPGGPITKDKAPGKTEDTNEPREYSKNVKTLVAEMKTLKTPEEVFKFGNDNEIATDERDTVLKAWDKVIKTIGLPKPEEPGSDLEPAAFLELISAVVTAEGLDSLEAKYALSKHDNADVVQAYEKKEDEFL